MWETQAGPSSTAGGRRRKEVPREDVDWPLSNSLGGVSCTRILLLMYTHTHTQSGTLCGCDGGGGSINTYICTYVHALVLGVLVQYFGWCVVLCSDSSSD